GFVLGGEQSGHVIQRDLATTGDGLLTAATVADVVVRTGRPLHDLASVMARLPQVLVNVRLPVPAAELDAVIERVGPAAARAERELGDGGRGLRRRSGTEPLGRVMVEAATADQARAVADGLAAEVEAAAR